MPSANSRVRIRRITAARQNGSVGSCPCRKAITPLTTSPRRLGEVVRRRGARGSLRKLRSRLFPGRLRLRVALGDVVRVLVQDVDVLRLGVVVVDQRLD